MSASRPPSATEPSRGPSSRLGETGALRALLPYLWPKDEPGLRARVVVAVLFLVGAKAATVTIPIWFKQAVDALSAPATAVAVPLAVILAYGLARVISLAFGEIRDAIFVRVEQSAVRKAGLSVFRHLHALSLRFHLERQTGGLTRALERGTQAIKTILSYALFSILPTLVEIVLVTVILARMLGIWYAVATLATVGAYLAYTFAISEWRTKFRRAMNETDQQANTKAIDSLLNYETVKYFGNEAHEAGRYDQALKRYEDAAVRSEQSLALLNVGQSLVISVGLVVVMAMAARGIVAGTLTLGDFVLVNTYLLQLYQPLNFFGMVYREIKQALTDMEAMFQLLHVEREVADAADARPLDAAGGEVRFEGVSFGYDPRRPILKGVDFTVPAGRTVAIVGPSGAGKSTISRLLFRFYDVSGGRICIDGQDIRAVTQASLRASIGIVPQDTVLFNDTIFYNIAYGRPGATPEEVERAARLAHIHDFVLGLPDGYRTMVGERGLKLSGGEKQRVAIARTILKDPAILMFDEATSALDTHTEREIQANLREVSRGRTTLVIAHRLSTVVDADQILVLEQGRVVERGRHAELLARGGAYAALWTRQQEARHDEEADKTLGPVPRAASA
ncbi:ABCB family ABC transporter ATP-binding protein/permease [Azospirillum sp. ST 5-10]|uniref:ABCB family ABC transporter ATP-binding protein/permease n=1 Tax=unclassified Azospirillum TaxID=2630922 RepID=UPI003F4A4042